MGLTIYNSDNEIIYDYSYGMLHAIRDVAIKVHTDRKLKKLDKKLLTNQYYPNLMHHSDCDGLLLADYFLDDINYKDSYMIGSLNGFIRDLRYLVGEILNHPRIKIENKKLIMSAINELIEGLEDELDNKQGIVRFQ